MWDHKIPKLTAEEIEKYLLTPREIDSIENYPTYETFSLYENWLEGHLPLERLRVMDLNANNLQKALRTLTARGIEPEPIGVRLGGFIKAGDEEWEFTL